MKKGLFVLFILSLSITWLPGQEVHFVFPDDAGVIDVTKAPYYADKTGVEDATAAIQAALSAYPNGNRTIYLPDGTYLISDRLDWPEGSGGGTYKRTMMQGESKSGTVIKLKDNCEGFQDPGSRKSMIYTGPAPAQRFRNAIRGLTVHTGTGNPGASGIQFNCSNEGTMQHVNIISGDGQGVYGLDLAFTNEIGPGYVYDLTVEGFDVGIMHGFSINSMTFEKITLRNQNVCGFRNGGNVSPIRGFRSENSVIAIENNGISSTMVLIDVELTGGDTDTPAVYNSGTIYARNMIRSGYNMTIKSDGGLGIDVFESNVKEYVSHGLIRQFHSPATSLNLPVKDWPEVPWSDLSGWANVRSFGAVGDGSADDRQAIQDAIDSGKETVYFPGGFNFKFNDTLYVRGNVRRIIGCEGKLTGSGTFLFEDDMQDVVVLERLNALYASVDIVHRSSKTLVVNSVTALPVVSEGSGDMFLINNVYDVLELRNPAQSVWVRQLNTEDGDETNVINDGAKLWMLGFKTERGKTKIHTMNGGMTELLGAHNYSTTGEKTDPWFIIENAAMSIIGARETNFNSAPYTEYVRELRSDDSKTLDRVYFPSSGAGAGVIPLYNGYIAEGAIPSGPENLQMTQTDLDKWFLDWDPVNDQGVDYYSVYVSEAAGGPYKMIANYLKEPGFTYMKERFSTFYFVVTAINEAGNESLYSPEYMVEIVEPGQPAPPVGLSGVHHGDSVVLSWNPNMEFEIASYEVYRKEPSGAFFLLQVDNISDTTWTDYLVDAVKTYLYSIRAVNIFGDKSSFSDTIALSPVGVFNEVSQDPEYSVFPNPAKKAISVLSALPKAEFSLVLLDIQGRSVLRSDHCLDREVLDIQEVKRGLYVIKISSEKGVAYTRVVIDNQL